jgi:TRAP transporter TAXI family solute receptor
MGLLPGASLAQEPSRLTFFRIGTGPTAETLYALGTAISAGISRPPGGSPCDEGGVCGVPGLIAVAQTRSGSISSLRDLRDGELESALVHADIAYWAYTEGGPFTDEPGVPDLRVIADLIPVSLHAVVRADSDIAGFRDLKGRTVSLGPRDSGVARFVTMLLRINGVDLNDIDPLYLRPGPAADALLTRDIDIFFDMGAAPIDAITELHGEAPIRLLSIDRNSVQTLRGFFPFMTNGVIAAEAYRGVAEATTLSLGVQWVTRAPTDPVLVSDITRALWRSDTADLFNQNNPGHRFPTVEEGRRPGLVPLHPGAEAFYEANAPSG